MSAALGVPFSGLDAMAFIVSGTCGSYDSCAILDRTDHRIMIDSGKETALLCIYHLQTGLEQAWKFAIAMN